MKVTDPQMQAETFSVHPASAPTTTHELDADLLSDNLIVGFSNVHEHVHPYVVPRSQLLRHAKDTGQRTFAITSAQPGNGKTHVACNVAAALSRLHPTMLIELDLRRPSIGKRLGLNESVPGIDEYLEGEASLAATGIKINDFQLTIHRARKPRYNSETLLGNPELEELFTATKGGNAIRIVDTPPAMCFDDMMLIMPWVDGVILVVEEGRTPARALRDTIKALSPTPIMGTILNRSISSPDFSNYYTYY